VSEHRTPGTPNAGNRLSLETRHLLAVLTWLALVLLAAAATWWAAHALHAALAVPD
jgi:hypothetical protein